MLTPTALAQISTDKTTLHSPWLLIDQARINTFAEVTEDRQFIHTDPIRAAETPFGGTVAHGFLTLSLLSGFVEQAAPISGYARFVNYGLNRVRFPHPVRVGSKVRGALLLAGFEDIDGGHQLTWQVTVEIDGAHKPACVAEMLVRAYF
jgi:acyl dehydratase